MPGRGRAPVLARDPGLDQLALGGHAAALNVYEEHAHADAD